MILRVLSSAQSPRYLCMTSQNILFSVAVHLVEGAQSAPRAKSTTTMRKRLFYADCHFHFGHHCHCVSPTRAQRAPRPVTTFQLGKKLGAFLIVMDVLDHYNGRLLHPNNRPRAFKLLCIIFINIAKPFVNIRHRLL